MTDANDTRAWLRWIRSRFGPTKSQERHVAREIAEYMTDGRDAYPTQESIAEAVGISDRAVRDAIVGLRRDRWLRIERRKRGSGRRGYSNTYVATYPDHVVELIAQGHTKPPKRERPTGSGLPLGHDQPTGSTLPLGPGPSGRIPHDQPEEFRTTNRKPASADLSEGNSQKEPTEETKRESARATSLQRAGETQPIDDSDRHASWNACISAYPPYSGKQNLIMAESAASTLVASGRATWALIEERTRRYAEFCRATGRQVMRPENFFATAPNPPCLQEWTIPEKPAPKQQTAAERITYRPPECEEPQR